MPVRLVTYDLNSPGQDYAALHEAIKSFGAWWHYLDSTWLVETSASVDAVAERRAELDVNDRLLVLDVTGDARQGWLSKDAWEWINMRM